MTASTEIVADWARSGAMALTGRQDGPPLLAPGRPATAVREGLAELGLSIPGLLGERAAYAGLNRNGPASCGGAMRVLPTLDGHLALSLSRPDDLASVPALVESSAVAEPWSAVRAWAARTTTAQTDSRCRLLGLPGGAVASGSTEVIPVRTTALGTRVVRAEPVVVDLTSLWAGPLCANLLGLTGAQVIKVESRSRPDGARRGTPEFYDLLHQGQQLVALDFSSGEDLGALRDLIHSADLVLEASRPRALQQLGIDAEEVVREGTSWLSITACGRASDAVGFGDDLAARAGLVVADGADLLPVGDALADPLAGVRAAVEGHRALASADTVLIDLSMVDVVAETLATQPDHHVVRRDDQWWIETDSGLVQVHDPERRR